MKRTSGLAIAALVAIGLLCTGCGRKDRTPEGAVELFLHATQEGDAAEVYRLLAPSSQRELQEKARLANAQAAGRKLNPEDLLAVGREAPRFEVTQIHALAVEGDRARVEIANTKKGVRETLELERVAGLWKVRLPAGQPPSSAPASRPAGSRS